MGGARHSLRIRILHRSLHAYDASLCINLNTILFVGLAQICSASPLDWHPLKNERAAPLRRRGIAKHIQSLTVIYIVPSPRLCQSVLHYHRGECWTNEHFKMLQWKWSTLLLVDTWQAQYTVATIKRLKFFLARDEDRQILFCKLSLSSHLGWK